MEQAERVATIQQVLGVRGVEVLDALLKAGLPIDVLDPLLWPNVWTNKKPTLPGIYWIRNVCWIDSGDKFLVPDMVQIWVVGGLLCFDLHVSGESALVYLGQIQAEFAGPLEPPR